MKNYVLLGASIVALICVTAGALTVKLILLQIVDIICIPLNIFTICLNIKNIVGYEIDKYDTEHWIKYHKGRIEL